MRKGKKSWGSRRIVRVGRSVVIVQDIGVHSTKFTRFIHVWILVDSTLVAEGLSLLFILLRRDPSQGCWHELWLLFTAVNPFIFKLKWKILHVFLWFVRVCLISHHIYCLENRTNRKTKLTRIQKSLPGQQNMSEKIFLINFYQETVDTILKAKLLMDLKDINTTFLSCELWAYILSAGSNTE